MVVARPGCGYDAGKRRLVSKPDPCWPGCTFLSGGSAMTKTSRRDFFTQVGSGMVAASIGASLADDLGFSTAFAADGPEELIFGPLEPLVALMQETPANRLLPLLSDRLRQGTSPRDLLAAGALANARTFGGEDYIGFHTMMALAPAHYMSAEMPAEQRALP